MDMITCIWLKYKANHPVIAATKKNRINAVRVLGSHSSVPGLSDLIVMGRQTFGVVMSEGGVAVALAKVKNIPAAPALPLGAMGIVRAQGC
jgi:hypothetical protein